MDEIKKVSGEILKMKEHIRELSDSSTLGILEKIECVKLEMECLRLLLNVAYETHRMKLQEEYYRNNPQYKKEANEH